MHKILLCRETRLNQYYIKSILLGQIHFSDRKVTCSIPAPGKNCVMGVYLSTSIGIHTPSPSITTTLGIW